MTGYTSIWTSFNIT